MNLVDDDGGGDIGWCPCGGAWFALAVPDDADDWPDPLVPPAVCISPQGDITGYAGNLRCIECGRLWAVQPEEPRPQLRLVTQDST